MVRIRNYIPERGDIVWINLNPQSGHEQSDRRLALVLSPSKYNLKVGLAIFCPITNQTKGYPFEVKIPKGLKISGVILSDHVKNLDWKAIKTEFICKLPNDITMDVVSKLSVLIL